MNKVVSIKSNSENANLDIIHEIESLLLKARLGEIQTFSYISITDKNEIINNRVGNWKSQIYSLIGILADQKYELLKIQNGD